MRSMGMGEQKDGIARVDLLHDDGKERVGVGRGGVFIDLAMERRREALCYFRWFGW